MTNEHELVNHWVINFYGQNEQMTLYTINNTKVKMRKKIIVRGTVLAKELINKYNIYNGI